MKTQSRNILLKKTSKKAIKLRYKEMETENLQKEPKKGIIW